VEPKRASLLDVGDVIIYFDKVWKFDCSDKTAALKNIFYAAIIFFIGWLSGALQHNISAMIADFSSLQVPCRYRQVSYFRHNSDNLT